jgi:hypothetical protein
LRYGRPRQYEGHLSPEQWQSLLAESKFLLGLGDPLLGPSAVDALAAGCVFLNPRYKAPVKEVYWSQHPWVEKAAPPEYVCSFDQGDAEQAAKCVEKALEADLPPLILPDLTKEAFMARLRGVLAKADRRQV